ncbi:MAG: hypothetical protein Q9218_008352, partial [Villophora microphyllina]
MSDYMGEDPMGAASGLGLKTGSEGLGDEVQDRFGAWGDNNLEDESSNGGDSEDEDSNDGNGGDEGSNDGNGGDEDSNDGNGGDEDSNDGYGVRGGDEASNDGNGDRGGDEASNNGNGDRGGDEASNDGTIKQNEDGKEQRLGDESGDEPDDRYQEPRKIGNPTELGAVRKKYNTQRYQRYDPKVHTEEYLNGIALQRMNTGQNFAIYDEYLLFMDPYVHRMNPTDIPQRGVRLDDFAMAIVLESNIPRAKLNKFWPAEFDSNGMPRAVRTPMGNAAKLLRDVGDVDVDGVVCEHYGYYYGWWKGLQLLCGKEGLDAGYYM